MDKVSHFQIKRRILATQELKMGVNRTPFDEIPENSFEAFLPLTKENPSIISKTFWNP